MGDAERFVKWVESYYGNYRAAVRKEVIRILSDYSMGELAELKDEILVAFSTQYRIPPDVAAIKKTMIGYRHDNPPTPLLDEMERILLTDQRREAAIEREKQRRLTGPVKADKTDPDWEYGAERLRQIRENLRSDHDSK